MFTKKLHFFGIPYQTNVPLLRKNAMHIDGTAAVWITPSNIDDVFRLAECSADTPHRLYPVGNLTNTLITNGKTEIPVVSFERLQQIEFTSDGVLLGSGCKLGKTARQMAMLGIDVLCSLATIPGTVGGAVRGNAGAFGASVEDAFLYADVFFPDSGTICRLTKERMHFSYRHSLLKTLDGWILRAAFSYRKDNPEKLLSQIRWQTEQRKIRQPVEFPSLGSAFLRTEDMVSAGYLLDQAGCRGMRIGDAAISVKHAGFIINLGQATAEDVLSLMKCARTRVKQKFSIDLQREIAVLGEGSM